MGRRINIFGDERYRSMVRLTESITVLGLNEEYVCDKNQQEIEVMGFGL